MLNHIYSLIDYLSIIKNNFKISEDEMLLFRGQANSTYAISASVFRDNTKSEKESYEEALALYPDKFHPTKHFENLITVQHYTTRTRLIDFTFNPLIALYFTCENNFDKDGKIYVKKIKKAKVCSHLSDKVMMLSCLAVMSSEDKNEIKDFCEQHNDNLDYVISDKDVKNNGALRRFMHEIRREFPAFETEIVAKDLLNGIYVRPSLCNERIRIQEGLFYILSLNYEKEQKDLEKDLYKIYVDKNSKKDILKDLKMIGISSSTVYPEFERKLMEKIINKRLDSVNIV